jgi:hypothetical protein
VILGFGIGVAAHEGVIPRMAEAKTTRMTRPFFMGLGYDVNSRKIRFLAYFLLRI